MKKFYALAIVSLFIVSILAIAISGATLRTRTGNVYTVGDNWGAGIAKWARGGITGRAVAGGVGGLVRLPPGTTLFNAVNAVGLELFSPGSGAHLANGIEAAIADAAGAVSVVLSGSTQISGTTTCDGFSPGAGIPFQIICSGTADYSSPPLSWTFTFTDGAINSVFLPNGITVTLTPAATPATVTRANSLDLQGVLGVTDPTVIYAASNQLGLSYDVTAFTTPIVTATVDGNPATVTLHVSIGRIAAIVDISSIGPGDHSLIVVIKDGANTVSTGTATLVIPKRDNGGSNYEYSDVFGVMGSWKVSGAQYNIKNIVAVGNEALDSAMQEAIRRASLTLQSLDWFEVAQISTQSQGPGQSGMGTGTNGGFFSMQHGTGSGSYMGDYSSTTAIRGGNNEPSVAVTASWTTTTKLMQIHMVEADQDPGPAVLITAQI